MGSLLFLCCFSVKKHSHSNSTLNVCHIDVGLNISAGSNYYLLPDVAFFGDNISVIRFPSSFGSCSTLA